MFDYKPGDKVFVLANSAGYGLMLSLPVKATFSGITENARRISVTLKMEYGEDCLSFLPEEVIPTSKIAELLYWAE